MGVVQVTCLYSVIAGADTGNLPIEDSYIDRLNLAVEHVDDSCVTKR